MYFTIGIHKNFIHEAATLDFSVVAITDEGIEAVDSSKLLTTLEFSGYAKARWFYLLI